jgi:DNA-binding transcriptional ArsR family regulator
MTASVAYVDQAAAAGAMLDPLRLRMLERLQEPGSATTLAKHLDLPRQQINYHLRELERHGLVSLVEERRKRNCTERVVRAVARSFVIDPALLGKLGMTPEEARDRLSASYLTGVAVRTIRDVAALEQRAKAAGKRLATLTLESEIRFASAERRAAFAEEFTHLFAALAAKYHDDQAPGGRTFRVFGGSYPKAKA